MIAIPFVYFSLLSYFLFKKNKKFDIATIISLMLAISGFFSVLMDILGVRPKPNYEISVIASFFYCFLLTLCLLPFIIYSNSSIQNIKPVRFEKGFKKLAYISILWFGLLVIISFNAIIIILTGDLGEMRQMLYKGDLDLAYMSQLPRPLILIMTVLNTVFACPWVLIFLAFFSLLIQKLPLKFFWMFLVASLSGPWFGILGVDRSQTAYWIISLIVIFFFFIPFMAKRIRKRIGIVLIILVITASFYLYLITDSRFGYVSSQATFDSSQLSVINYLGQNYVYFCYFFDTFDSPWKTLNLIFPFISKYFMGETIVGGVPIQQTLDLKTGESTGVFYTYLGQILVSAGKVALFLFCFFYTFLSFFATKAINKKKVSSSMCYLYLLLSSIMFLGLFGHYYSTPYRTFSALFFLVILKIAGDLPAKRY